jgi:2-amino-4-hydroxy-6-hydroxymethyldihydropteridine diphosphokinase
MRRVRGPRWGPRTLDVDVIVYGTEASDDPELTLPHPRAHERAFVLAPWHDVDPGAVVPGRGPIADLLAAVGTAGVRLRRDARLRLPVEGDGEGGTVTGNGEVGGGWGAGSRGAGIRA